MGRLRPSRSGRSATGAAHRSDLAAAAAVSWCGVELSCTETLARFGDRVVGSGQHRLVDRDEDATRRPGGEAVGAGSVRAGVRRSVVEEAERLGVCCVFVECEAAALEVGS